MTAQTAYTRQTQRATALMAELTARMARHAQLQAQRPDDYGYSGDLGHIVQLLSEAVDSLACWEQPAPVPHATGE